MQLSASSARPLSRLAIVAAVTLTVAAWLAAPASAESPGAWGKSGIEHFTDWEPTPDGLDVVQSIGGHIKAWATVKWFVPCPVGRMVSLGTHSTTMFVDADWHRVSRQNLEIYNHDPLVRDHAFHLDLVCSEYDPNVRFVLKLKFGRQ